MAESLPPLPLPDEDSRPFWEACARHELRVQRCADCGRNRFPPRPRCPACRSDRGEWVRLSGAGTVYSRVVAHPPVLPAFRERVPYAVLLVELDEDPTLRMVGGLVGSPPEQASIGSRVQVQFEDVTGEVSLPQWRLVENDPERAVR